MHATTTNARFPDLKPVRKCDRNLESTYESTDTESFYAILRNMPRLNVFWRILQSFYPISISLDDDQETCYLL